MKTSFNGILLLSAILTTHLTRANPIPSDRIADWSHAGVTGGIPARSNIFCDVTQFIPGSTLVAKADGVSDDAEAIIAAIRLCPSNHVVLLPAGTYRITQPLAAGLKSDITLRGAGMGKTILLADLSSPSVLLKWGSGVWNPSTNDIRTLVAGYSRGSTEITLENTAGIGSGTLLLIDQLNDPDLVSAKGSGGNWGGDRPHDGSRCLSQMVRVTTVNGNVASITPPLLWSYKPNLQPQAVIQRGSLLTYAIARRFGIEDLTFNTSSEILTDYVNLYTVSDAWIKGVEFRNIIAKALFLHCYQNVEIRGCFFNDAPFRTVGRGYGMIIRLGTGVLVVDNIFDRLRVPFWIHGGSSGGVAAYNYTHSVWSDDSSVQNSHYNAGHGPHGMMNLFEGNVGHSFQMDGYYGSASHVTLFRNHLHGSDPANGSLKRVISIDKGSYTNSVVGNVLGSEVHTWEYEIAEPSYSMQRNSIFRLGYPNMGNNSYTELDERVKSSLLRHGNFDFATKTVQWDPLISERTLPDSLFLPGRPTWWPNTVAWPPIGPDRAPMTTRIPAQMRFDSGELKPLSPPKGVKARRADTAN